MNMGFYIMNIMNSTNIFLNISKIVRNLKIKKYRIYSDTFFLISFGYYRIYTFSYILYENNKNGLLIKMPYELSVLIKFLWLLQMVWFYKLTKIYTNDYIYNGNILHFLKI